MLLRDSKTLGICGAVFAAVFGILCLIGSAGEKEPVKAAHGADEKKFEAWWANLEDEESVEALARIAAACR